MRGWVRLRPLQVMAQVEELIGAFLMFQDWKSGKRRAEKEEAVGPMMFTLVEPEAAELDVAQV